MRLKAIDPHEMSGLAENAYRMLGYFCGLR